MLRQRRIWPRAGMALVTALGTFASTACEPKSRPFAEVETVDGGASPGSVPEADAPALTPSQTPGSSEEPPAPAAIDPGTETAGSQSGDNLDSAPATDGGLAGFDAGRPVCVRTGFRDCASELDNDCDGQPDNVVDDVCRCVPGTVEACDAHPGFDGQGLCKPGTRTCLVGDANASSAFGECVGAIGPGPADSCAIAGDDSDCDGLPNEGCTCVDGTTQQCGSMTDLGICAFGTSTCAGGAFGPCVGAVAPSPRDTCLRGDDSNCNGIPNEGCVCIDGDTQPCGPAAVGICRGGIRTCSNGIFGECVGAVNASQRDCRSPADNNCDGRPDNTIDNVCECIPGQGNGPCSGDPSNARCDNQGQCAPCEIDADCALSVPGGQCQAGVCRAPTLPTGAVCGDDNQCSSGRCETWFRDRDGDGFGTTDDIQRTCGAVSGSSLPPSGYTAISGDCCDLSGVDGVQARTIFPGQTQFFDVPQAACPNVALRDYNCSGDIEFLHQDATERGGGSCEFTGCNGTTIWDISQTGGTPPACGAAGPILTCSGVSGACTPTPEGFTINFCH